MNEAEIDAGFERVRTVRFLRDHIEEVHDPSFWQALNPHLAISERPFSTAIDRAPVDKAWVDRAAGQIVDEGYLQGPALVPHERVAAMRLAIERITGAGFPSGFACVYDEFYQAFQGLDELFAPLLGERYQIVLQGLWTYFVPAGDSVHGIAATIPPHRDTLGPDPAVMARQTPSIVNVWIPLTDISTDDSCLYVVLPQGDPGYYSADRGVHQERIRLQDIRALPAAAGSVLGWSTHVIHWGSRSSRLAKTPRMSMTVYFQRRGIEPTHSSAKEFGDPIPFRERLRWVLASLNLSELWKE